MPPFLVVSDDCNSASGHDAELLLFNPFLINVGETRVHPRAVG